MPIIIIALLAILGGGTVAVSQNSVPGDALFTVKTATEDVRVFFAGSERQNELRLEFAADRLKEIGDIVESAEEKIEDRRMRGLDDAIDNLEDNLSGVADRARRDRNRGNSDRAAQTLEDLKAQTGLLSEVMESQRRKSSRQEVRNKIELALERVDGVRVRIENEAEDIEKSDNSGPSSAQSSAGKINAAENKLAEVERKFERVKDSLLADNKVEVEKKIAESKSLIQSAKRDSDSNKFKDAFEKAQQAIRILSLANALISRDDEIRIISNKSVNQIIDDMRSREQELRGRENEPGEDIRGNADENEIRGRDNEIEAPGDQPRQEDRGQEQELRGRENEPGEDIRGNADENEIRGRDNEIEAPGDQPKQEDRSSGVNSSDDSSRGSDDSGSSSGRGSSGRGGSDD